jgi:hypothetical protein
LHYALSLGFVSSFCRTSSDTISHGKITTQYSYHHGYWDGTERDYLGFGRVDKRDTEEFNLYNSCTSINSYAEKIPEVFFHHQPKLEHGFIKNQCTMDPDHVLNQTLLMNIGKRTNKYKASGYG